MLVVSLLAVTAGRAPAATLTLAWNASSGASGYIIYYGTKSGSYTGQVDVGSATQAPVSGLADGQTYFFAVKAYSATGLQSPFSGEVSGTTPASAPTTPPPTYLGFTGNGSKAIIWQNSDGSLESWFLNGVTATQSVLLNPSTTGDPLWRVVGAADFNNDGYPDLLLQHATTGVLRLWTMKGTQRVSSGSLSLAGPSDPNWHVVGIADFNNDSRPDILFQHAVTGVLVVWFMNGSTFVSASVLSPTGPLDPAWHVVGVADLNGDRAPDLVLQHPVTGVLVLWYMNGVQLIGSSMTNPTGPLDPNWRIAAVVDLNGDGKPDFVLQHPMTGQLVSWYMSGTTVTSGTLFTPSGQGDANWAVMAIR